MLSFDPLNLYEFPYSGQKKAGIKRGEREELEQSAKKFAKCRTNSRNYSKSLSVDNVESRLEMHDTKQGSSPWLSTHDDVDRTYLELQLNTDKDSNNQKHINKSVLGQSRQPQ